MRNLHQCRRGSVTFATVAALIPLIGFLALGAEAGSWFVTRNQAQNTADSAALAGALAVANANVQPNFGTLNGFASGVVVTSGVYTAGTGFAAGAVPANAVRAVVTECRPQSLSLVVYTGSCNGTASNIKIEATAIASVQSPVMLPCVMTLTGPITFNDGAVQINAPKCALASNGTPLGIDFKVAPKIYNVGSATTAGSCSGSLCGSVRTYAPPTSNPFAPLTSAMTSPSKLTITSACSGGLTPYTATSQCANSLSGSQKSSANQITVSGVYFFSDLTLSGGGSLFTQAGVTATIILLPDAGLTMTGNSSINVAAPTTAPSASSLPSQLQPFASLLSNMSIFDVETSPKIGGTSTMLGSGVFYLPKAALNFQGDPLSASSTCTEIIAASIQFSGSPTLDNTGCPASSKLKSQVVTLVQ